MTAPLGPYLARADLGSGGFGVGHWCPACKMMHVVRLDGSAPWTFNGNTARPTLSPSVRVTFGDQAGARVCHYFVRDGQIEFCSDSTHELAGMTVPLPVVPTEEAEFWN